jgi:hypothetical protein
MIMPGGAAMVGTSAAGTWTGPVVFMQVAGPVGAGFVDTLSHPRNAIGFTAQ